MTDKISVVMGNYNCSKYIEEAIDSVLAQTYENWELIIVDDCSTDDSVEKILKYKDDRIVLIRSNKNEGLAVSLNKSIEQASGSYLARLDPDDVSFPGRFEKQLSFLKENKDISICGSNIELFGEVNGHVSKLPLESNRLMANIPFCSPLPHSTWMIKREKFSDGFFYNPEYRSSQDYEMMYRLWKEGKQIACIKEPLVKYRVRNDSISGMHRKRRDANTRRIQQEVLKQMGITPSEEMIDDLNFDHGAERRNIKELIRYCFACHKLADSNKGDLFFSQSQLRLIITKTWLAQLMRVFGIR